MTTIIRDSDYNILYEQSLAPRYIRIFDNGIVYRYIEGQLVMIVDWSISANEAFTKIP